MVSKSFIDDNMVLVGTPAQVKKESGPWYESLYGNTWKERVQKCEVLRQQLGIL